MERLLAINMPNFSQILQRNNSYSGFLWGHPKTWGVDLSQHLFNRDSVHGLLRNFAINLLEPYFLLS